MKKVYITIITIFVLGGIVVMAINNDKSQSEFNPEDINIKDNNKLISKNKAVRKFEPGQHVASENLDISMSITTKSLNGSQVFIYKVKNKGKTKQFKFNTSQRYDYEITDASGKVIYHYSDGKSFLQALKTISLERGEELEYEIVPPQLAPGNYQLSVRLVATEYGLMNKTIDFTIE